MGPHSRGPPLVTKVYSLGYYMSHSLNFLKSGYIGDYVLQSGYIGDYVLQGLLTGILGSLDYSSLSRRV